MDYARIRVRQPIAHRVRISVRITISVREKFWDFLYETSEFSQTLGFWVKFHIRNPEWIRLGLRQDSQ